MPQFIIAYKGAGQPESPEAGKAHRERWMAWIAGLGEAIVNPGTPIGPTKHVTPDGVEDFGADRMNGFSVVEADDLDAALEMAKTCPFLEMGTLEVGQLMSM